MKHPFGFASWHLVLQWAILFFGWLMLLGANGNVAAQQVDASRWKRGFEGFNLICDQAGLEIIPAREWAGLPASEKVLVILETTKSLPWVDRYLERGGVALIATDDTDSRVLRRSGVEFMGGPVVAEREVDRFNGFDDCPIVTDTRLHPALNGVKQIVTNRPGVARAKRERLETVAYLPPSSSSRFSGFIVAGDLANDGKLIAIGDHSVFTNQMLLCGDNAVLAWQSLNWLTSDGRRKKLLVLANGVEQAPVDPDLANINLPPPTREEILAAMKNLPPSALLEFGNAVATVVEDENMVNEFLQKTVARIHPRALNRAWIFLAFFLICLIAMAAYVFQSKRGRSTASELLSRRSRNRRRSLSGSSKTNQAIERQMAAKVLLDSLCLQAANRRFDDWPSFPDELFLTKGDAQQLLYRRLKKMGEQVRKQGPEFWKLPRLEKLKRCVDECKRIVQREQAETSRPMSSSAR